MVLQTPSFSISEKAPEPTAKSPEKTKSTEQAVEQVPERAKGSTGITKEKLQAQKNKDTAKHATKSSIQIIKETLQELKQPSAWLRYTKEIAAGAAGQADAQGKKGSKGEKKRFWQALQKPSFWITVALLIILAIVLAWIYL